MYREQIEHIRFKLLKGVITYDEAKTEAQPIINEMNKRGREIAKKHKQKFKPFTFIGLMR